MDLKKIIQDYLMSVTMMQLATVKDNKPWVSTLYFAFDIDLDIYWISRSSRRHSQELSKNHSVSAAFAVSHTYGEKVRGLQVEGEAVELQGEEADVGKKIYSGRFWIVEDRGIPQTTEDHQGVYKLKPKAFYLYDEVNFSDNPSQMLKI